MCIRDSPNFDQDVVKTTGAAKNVSDPKMLNKRKEGLERYFKSILSNRANYCDVLYDFINYDFINKRRRDSPMEAVSNDFDIYKFRAAKPDNNPKERNNEGRALAGSKDGVRGAGPYVEFGNCVLLIDEVKRVRRDEDIMWAYMLMLEEPYPNNLEKVFRRIFVYKFYKDFENLHRQLFRVYEPQGVQLPELPVMKRGIDNLLNPINLGVNFIKNDPSQSKDLENYLNNVFKLGGISNNEDIRQFFLVPRFKSQFMQKDVYGTEQYDFRDLSGYEEVQGDDGLMSSMKNVVNKVDGGIKKIANVANVPRLFRPEQQQGKRKLCKWRLNQIFRYACHCLTMNSMR
eukprot:TRINITY_DN12774_c0_g1_i2.p1 TRINITY_DN12774_c0_g1~~TRINITY_DN12774_c0_g1_i2.p1  ORF type:complete len:391 (-),score=87.80 TRINITY_DN12774_c0_g1_i2:126-1157(-)